jgi:hypothetical protein
VNPNGVSAGSWTGGEAGTLVLTAGDIRLVGVAVEGCVAALRVVDVRGGNGRANATLGVMAVPHMAVATAKIATATTPGKRSFPRTISALTDFLPRRPEIDLTWQQANIFQPKEKKMSA